MQLRHQAEGSDGANGEHARRRGDQPRAGRIAEPLWRAISGATTPHSSDAPRRPVIMPGVSNDDAASPRGRRKGDRRDGDRARSSGRERDGSRGRRGERDGRRRDPSLGRDPGRRRRDSSEGRDGRRRRHYSSEERPARRRRRDSSEDRDDRRRRPDRAHEALERKLAKVAELESKVARLRDEVIDLEDAEKAAAPDVREDEVAGDSEVAGGGQEGPSEDEAAGDEIDEEMLLAEEVA
eukprot:scaffold549_cov117-Isochrysis_galbana.AAC.11